MSTRKQTGQARPSSRDPFALLRQISLDLDRIFGPTPERAAGSPAITLCEHDGRPATTVDLPGLENEGIKVQVAHGHLSIAGGRRPEVEDVEEEVKDEKDQVDVGEPPGDANAA